MNEWHMTHLSKSMRKGKTPEQINELRKAEYEKNKEVKNVEKNTGV